MSLESSSTIAGLIATNPVTTDEVQYGANHIRLIKAVLKATFPGAGGSGFNTPITAKEADLNALVNLATYTTDLKGKLQAMQTAIDNVHIVLPVGTFFCCVNDPSDILGYGTWTSAGQVFKSDYSGLLNFWRRVA